MATKPKKKQGAMHVYRLDTGAGGMTPESPAVTKKIASSGSTWGMPRRSKTYRENEQGFKLGENVVVSEGRKSVSIVDQARNKSVSIKEGRKSVSSSKGEAINVGTVAAFVKVKVLVTDMPGFMQVHAFRRARQTYDSLDKFSSKHLACDMKKEFDSVWTGLALHRGLKFRLIRHPLHGLFPLFYHGEVIHSGLQNKSPKSSGLTDLQFFN